MRERFSRISAIGVAVSVFVCLIFSPAAAQIPELTPPEYPTVAALEAVAIPPRDRVALAQELLGVGEIAPPPDAAPPREVGDRTLFHATNATENRTFEVKTVLRAVGERIYLWVEENEDVSDADLQALAQAFDERVYPNVRTLWGSEATPGIDGDPRIYGLFARDLGSGTAAYFISEHTYPVEAVPTSNEHEMFFFNLDGLGSYLDLQAVESILAHEFQHMIRFNLQMNEEYWLNEGFSQFTQLHLYDIPIWELAAFLNAPGTQLNTWAEEVSQRAQNYGAAMLFVTYFYDRYGLDALQQLSADSSPRALDGVDAVLQSLGEPGVDEFFADWVLANYLFDPAIGDGRYGYRSIPPGIISAAPLMTVTDYPLQTDGAANQYATDYYVLTDLDDADTLTITLTAPEMVNLVPVAAASGQQMWYSNKADVSSTTLTRAFDLSDAGSATLNYKIWYQTEQFWDYGYVLASGDGGDNWTILQTPNTTLDNPHGTAYGAGYTGDAGGWLDESLSLDDYADGEALVRFQMITDDAVTAPGMVIDDVSIPEIGYREDFERDDGGWQAEGWVRIDNRLPQQVWVQAVQQSGKDATVTRWLASGDGSWTLPLDANVDQVVLALSPFAPVTTLPMPYTLNVTANP